MQKIIKLLIKELFAGTNYNSIGNRKTKTTRKKSRKNGRENFKSVFFANNSNLYLDSREGFAVVEVILNMQMMMSTAEGHVRLPECEFEPVHRTRVLHTNVVLEANLAEGVATFGVVRIDERLEADVALEVFVDILQQQQR